MAMIECESTYRGVVLNGDGRESSKRRRPIQILELRAAGGAGGGPEKTILQSAARSDPSRFAVTVCYLRDMMDGNLDIAARAKSLEVDYIEIRQRHALDPAIWKTVRRLVRERHIDIVHAHDYKTDLIAWLVGRCETVVPLSTAHGWTGHGWKEKLVYYPIDKRLLVRFPRVIAVSSQIRDVLLQCGGRADRIQTVLNGIDHHTYRRHPERERAARVKLGLGQGEVVVGGVGRLAPEKRFEVLLEAVAILIGGGRELRLVIAGDGPERGALERQADQLGIGPSCRFLGHCPDIIELHHALDVLVQSSAYEGTPNVVLEAMALETPIVATDVGGTAEIAPGGLVPPGDPQAIARAIERSLTDREATARRVREARQRVEGMLSFDARMQTVERIYEELVAEDRCRPARHLRAASWHRGP
jgi:glycosyltransferase involved in cell wall biosynthesis